MFAYAMVKTGRTNLVLDDRTVVSQWAGVNWEGPEGLLGACHVLYLDLELALQCLHHVKIHRAITV